MKLHMGEDKLQLTVTRTTVATTSGDQTLILPRKSSRSGLSAGAIFDITIPCIAGLVGFAAVVAVFAKVELLLLHKLLNPLLPHLFHLQV